MSKLLERIKAASALKSIDIEVPEWDSITIRIRELTAGVAAELGTKVKDGANEDAMVIWVIASAEDPETGEKVFEDNEETRALLRGKSASAIMRLGNACLKINGLTEDAAKEALKN